MATKSAAAAETSLHDNILGFLGRGWAKPDGRCTTFHIYLHFSRHCIPTVNAHTGVDTRSFLSSPLHVGPQEKSSLLFKCFHVFLLILEHPQMAQPSLKFFVIFPVGNGCLFWTNGCLESSVNSYLSTQTGYN